MPFTGVPEVENKLGKTVPVLRDGDRVVRDSFDIALYLDEAYPDRPSLFGGETLHELRHALLAAESEITGGAHPRVAPMADVRDLGSLLQRAGFTLPVADMDTITVTYDHPVKLMHDLRAMGEANCLTDRSHRFMRRDVLMRACALYSDRHGGADGRIPATFQIVYLTGWHPDDSQPQPLKPGSGKVSLSSALKSAIGKEEKT